VLLIVRKGSEPGTGGLLLDISPATGPLSRQASPCAPWTRTRPKCTAPVSKNPHIARYLEASAAPPALRAVRTRLLAAGLLTRALHDTPRVLPHRSCSCYPGALQTRASKRHAILRVRFVRADLDPPQTLRRHSSTLSLRARMVSQVLTCKHHITAVPHSPTCHLCPPAPSIQTRTLRWQPRAPPPAPTHCL
jgi:hypothetical protein